MCRSGADNGWALAWQLAQTQDVVVALQEVPAAPPAGVTHLWTRGRIDAYAWDQGRAGLRYLTILNGDRPTVLRIAMTTTWEPAPADVFDVTNPRGERNILAVANRDDDILFASSHALSGGGWDVRFMVPAVRARANAAGIRNWALLADFNRDPTVTRGIAAQNEAHIYNTGRATRESGTELDYMVSNVDTDNWHGTVLPNGASDHWPVAFRGLRAGGEAQEVTIHPDTPDPVVLDVAGEATGNGSHLITYHQTGGANQRWRITPTGGRAAEPHRQYPERQVPRRGPGTVVQRRRADEHLGLPRCGRLPHSGRPPARHPGLRPGAPGPVDARRDDAA
ncbi:hypothetical protein OG223_01710 [Streptomyces sp. NBC_01478]|uniref:hypothetical protein n=1 Tax=Streptomyces sp. NBC_01478 TaxID=2903882 RepID=UPI002E2FDCCE|nr:hypothetical protein [Streptomyces sp. NBC_01478]